MISRHLQHGLNFVPREVASVNVRPDDSGQQPLLVFKFRRNSFFQSARVGTLLHGGQNAGLFSLGHATESYSCKKKETTLV